MEISVSQKEFMMDHWLHCTVSPGQFTGEYVVEARDFRGEMFSLFVPEEFVDYTSEPTQGSGVRGFLHVERLEESGDLVLVRLPRAPLENGSTVTVKTSQVTQRSARELA